MKSVFSFSDLSRKSAVTVCEELAAGGGRVTAVVTTVSETGAGDVSMSMDGGVLGREEGAWSAGFFDWIMAVSLDWLRFGCGVRLILILILVLPFFRFGEADSSTWRVSSGVALSLFLPALQGSPGAVDEGKSDGGVTMHSSEDDGGDVRLSSGAGLDAGCQPEDAFCCARIGPQVSGRARRQVRDRELGQ